jgi:hypothetical protein
MIHLIYASTVNVGGWATFTRHLHDTLLARGHAVQIWKVGNNTEGKQRPWGPDHTYRNLAPCDFHKELGNPRDFIVIAVIGKDFKPEAETLIKMGGGVVIHDTTEHSTRMGVDYPWVIRRALLGVGNSRKGVFIRHPYIRAPRSGVAHIRKGAVAPSRIDFDKNLAMMLDANRMGANIDIIGFENRLYTRNKIVPLYPEWVQSHTLRTYPRTGALGIDRLRRARFMVDLTDIRDDGGGTQYTFLEGWDAGAVPVVGEWWIRPKDDMIPGVNCIAVGTAQSLLKAVRSFKSGPTLGNMVAGGHRQLIKHDPRVLEPAIMEWLETVKEKALGPATSIRRTTRLYPRTGERAAKA